MPVFGRDELGGDPELVLLPAHRTGKDIANVQGFAHLVEIVTIFAKPK